jgi:murein DD-endopeptidase MepM/ murein hydrolase activator NlpD
MAMTVYRLPFNEDAGWQLWTANWDSPGGGHGPSQGYAFDFVHANHDGVGEEGKNVRAARAGVIIETKHDRACNVWKLDDPTDPCFGAPGEGNFVFIRHGDGSVASYCHLLKDKVFVQIKQYVLHGQVIMPNGNTGNSSTAHLHFDVRGVAS